MRYSRAIRRSCERLHPLVILIYGCLALAVVLAVSSPLVLGLCLIGALIVSTALKGFRVTLSRLGAFLAFALAIALINGLFSSSGATLLWRFGLFSVSVEGIAYGCFAGLVLVAVALWGMALGDLLDGNQIFLLMGSRFPRISLMIALSLRLLPLMVRRGKLIGESLGACSAANRSAQTKVQGPFRQISTLMAWSMENTLIAGETMRARSWGRIERGGRRTNYRSRRLSSFDWMALGILGLLTAWFIISLASGGSRALAFGFYPHMSSLEFSWSLVPLALFYLLPGLLFGWELCHCPR